MSKDINKMIDEKISEGREYRNMQQMDIRAISDDEKMQASGYATTFDEPYLLYDWGNYKVYEKIDRHAFDDCDMSDVICQYNHEGRVFARNKNGTLQLAIDNHGLKTDMELSGTELGRQVYEELKGGYSDKMSFGFKVGEDKREITEDRENNVTTVMRTITKITKLYDVSIVSIPANDATEVSARNFSEGVINEIKEEILANERRNRQKQKIRILCEVNK